MLLSLRYTNYMFVYNASSVYAQPSVRYTFLWRAFKRAVIPTDWCRPTQGWRSEHR